jgi:hypothetical protein
MDRGHFKIPPAEDDPQAMIFTLTALLARKTMTTPPYGSWSRTSLASAATVCFVTYAPGHGRLLRSCPDRYRGPVDGLVSTSD